MMRDCGGFLLFLVNWYLKMFFIWENFIMEEEGSRYFVFFFIEVRIWNVKCIWLNEWFRLGSLLLKEWCKDRGIGFIWNVELRV